MNEGLCFLGALALELSPGTRVGRTMLSVENAGRLAEEVARDLARFHDKTRQLDLALFAGVFDPVELLRPGWPLHAELERLMTQAPDLGEARIIAFGDGTQGLPEQLRPDSELAAGVFRLLPLLLRGEPNIIAEVGATFEETLLETGMAAARTALLVQETFAATVEHVRYLSVHDLAAMMAMQYDHAGLAPVWPLIENALLSPEREAWLDAPPEPMLRQTGNHARIALFDDDDWATSQYAPVAADSQMLARGLKRFQMRQRQIAAVLEAHGITVTFDHCPNIAEAKNSLLS